MLRLRGFAASSRHVARRGFAVCARHGLLGFAIVAIAGPAYAQQSRFEVGAGVTWTGGFDAGGLDALETRPTAGSAPLTLFATDSQVTPAAGVRARAAWFVTRQIAIEGTAEYSRPALETRIGNDFEQATGTLADTTIVSYLFGGSMLYHFGRGRLVPFAFGGAGYLRQLDAESTTAVTGAELHAGGGVTYELSSRFRLSIDAGVSSRDKSIAFEEKRRTLPVVSASLSYRF
jgi:hypothetical protein